VFLLQFGSVFECSYTVQLLYQAYLYRSSHSVFSKHRFTREICQCPTYQFSLVPPKTWIACQVRIIIVITIPISHSALAALWAMAVMHMSRLPALRLYIFLPGPLP
jgi:hypothetical protein